MPTRFLLVSTHTEQVTGYSKVAYNMLKQLSTLHPLVKTFHFGFQRTPVNIQKPSRPLQNVIQYDAAANEMPREQGFGFNKIKEYVEMVNPDIIMIYNDPIVVNQFIEKLKDGEKTYKLWVYLDQVYPRAEMSLLRNIENFSDRIFCFTQSWMEHLKTRLTTPNIPFSVLEHGVDYLTFRRLPDAERGNVRKQLNIPMDAKVILNMNRNSQRKRLDITIMAFAQLLKKYPDVHYQLLMITAVRPETGAFYHPLAVFMAELERLGLDPIKYGTRLSVVDTSPPNAYYNDESINQLYNVADVGINTSSGEGFGLCQIEHMATGAPQVVFDIGGYRAFMNDDNGVLIPPTILSYLPMTAGVGMIEQVAPVEAVVSGIETAFKMAENEETRKACMRSAIERPWSKVCDQFLEEVVNFSK